MFRFLRILQTAALMGALFVARAPAVDAADTAPPDPVEDLRAATSTDATITLAWTAPGDDGKSGTVSSYDLRMAAYKILTGEELTAPIVGGEPDPRPGGETQTMEVKGLKIQTKYWFVMKSQDRAGNIAKFSNIAMGETKLDTTGPLIEKVKAVDLTHNSGRIVWVTHEPATSELNYGETEGYGQRALASSLVTEHSLPVGGLAPDTTYHYVLKSIDQYGNATETVNMTFQTLASSTAPIIFSGHTNAQATASAGPPKPAASIVFSPTTINLKSRATWMTAVLKMPAGGRAGMKFDALRVNGTVKPTQAFAASTQTVLNRYGTLWLRFRRADIAALVPYEVSALILTLTGETATGTFSAAQTLKVANNITQAEWERQQALKKEAFEKDKAKRMSAVQKQIDALKQQLEALMKKFESLQAEQFPL
ncbi:hypothetical protein A3J43_04200 [Candidatus Uhrbacteria bacterium RIFCSPHIGHO2_12_FULL_54_23]|uniref:Fibronectin type-III domain-containing protein n=1 Tax=Candidatus Uhrbacteria bacterium RIFCSPHIGHO2_12_FULL_54_23 TaxID=1802397 RepID=A0A1F7UIG7_9BACT|nr:MAG: hypothetical protein A3J43_04200 [Candidatus Uhrbacteria bacterium RIFCSPHIGHO2_12_FULL_54_23]